VVGLAEARDDEAARRQLGHRRRADVRRAVVDHVLVDLVADQQRCRWRQQLGQLLHLGAALQTVALGLCGELTMIARVRGVIAAAIAAKSGRKLPGVSGTRTTVPPASSMFGHVAVVARLEHDDLVARVHAAQHRGQDGLGGAGGDGDLAAGS
jgi:hypothetical protein